MTETVQVPREALENLLDHYLHCYGGIHDQLALDVCAMLAAAPLRPTLRWSRAQGHTFVEMREIVRNSELYRHGDTILVWVNEGDLLGLTALAAVTPPLSPEKP